MNLNTEFELFTQRVYQKLVNNEVIKPTSVQHDIKLKGKSGCEHQIDVFWEYEIHGNMHRVVIECKNYDSLVPIGKVRDFYGVLHDLGNVRGIMVSRKGYQEGAKKFADFYGIFLKKLRVPEWNETIGSILFTTQYDYRRTFYKIDEEWAAHNNFDIQAYRNRQSMLHFESDNWCYGEYLHIDLNNRFIRSSKGKKITSLEKLARKLPKKHEPGSSFVFSFEDGWIESKYLGTVKVNEVKFIFGRDVQKTTVNLVADGFVEAVLNDAISGITVFVPKY